MHLQLRNLHPNDAPLLAQYANNPRIAERLTNSFPHPYTQTDAQAFIQKMTASLPANVQAIEVEGQFTGCIGLHPENPNDIFAHNAELGYWLAEPFWGQGIMTQAVELIVAYGFESFPIERIFARPFGTNIGSARVLEKAGFQLEARLERTIFKNGQYYDELIYSRWK